MLAIIFAVILIAIFAYFARSRSRIDRPEIFERPTSAYLEQGTDEYDHAYPSAVISQLSSNVIPDVHLNAEQTKLFHEIEHSSDHFFITGRAGTGKSSLLRYYVQHSAHKDKIAVCAPTGIAALLVGGKTIHSLFNISPHELYTPSTVTLPDEETQKILRNIHTLVIDEISMVRSDFMDYIDAALKLVRENKRSFGGVRLIMFGDLFQLEPVVDRQKRIDIRQDDMNMSIPLDQYLNNRYNGIFFFNADVWKTDGNFNDKFHIRSLTQYFRQAKDGSFYDHLNVLRVGSSENHPITGSLAYVNTRVIGPTTEIKDDTISIVATNKIAHRINDEKLSRIMRTQYRFSRFEYGDIADIRNDVEKELSLKEGAQVMFIVNDKADENGLIRWRNGTICKIHRLSNSNISVDIDGRIYDVPKYRWENKRLRYDDTEDKVVEDTIGYIEQYPLRLAWAITVHKSQGQTFRSVYIDLGAGAFAAGQTYVALSRCRTLNGLYLSRPLRDSDIKVSEEVRRLSNLGGDHDQGARVLKRAGQRSAPRRMFWIHLFAFYRSIHVSPTPKNGALAPKFGVR